MNPRANPPGWWRARPSSRAVGRTLVILAVALAGWTAWLVGALDADAHRWHWVGLDVLQTLGLLLAGVALLLGRRLPAASAALVAAPLFCYDALQDSVSSHRSTPDLLLALVMALGVELPLSVALLRVAWWCLWCPRWCAPATGRTPEKRLATVPPTR